MDFCMDYTRTLREILPALPACLNAVTPLPTVRAFWKPTKHELEGIISNPWFGVKGSN